MTRDWAQAVELSDAELLRQLIAAGAEIDARDGHGQTALMRAARAGRADVVQILLDHGAALDHTAKFRLSALMLAVINGQADIVRALVVAGADPDIRGAGAPGFEGKTARDIAQAQDRADLVSALEGGDPGGGVGETV